MAGMVEINPVSGTKTIRGLASVIIPAFNAGQWIAECLASVVQQSYSPVEIIVVDDGSTDDTCETVTRQFGDSVTLIRQENQGQASATANAMSNARGEFIAFLDSDDLWTPGKLALQTEFMNRHPEVAVLYTDAEEFVTFGTGHRRYLSLHPLLRTPDSVMTAMAARQIPLRSTAMVRHAFLESTGIHTDRQSASVDDIALFMEIAGRNGKFAMLEEVTTYRRMHGGNISRDHHRRFESRIPMYHRLLQRCADCSPEWIATVHKALSDAEYRVGESWFGQDEYRLARGHFANAWRSDRGNVRALLRTASCLLPASLIHAMRRVRQMVRRRPASRD